MRKEFKASVKAAAAMRANGHCEKCTRKLLAGDFHYDHDNPDGLTGEPTLENCRVLCKSCHEIKTKRDVHDIAKAKRRERRAAGIRKPSRFPCSRDSRWKKRMDGSVVER